MTRSELSSVGFFTSMFANTWLDLLDSLSTDGRHVLFYELHRALDTRLHASALTSKLKDLNYENAKIYGGSLRLLNTRNKQ